MLSLRFPFLQTKAPLPAWLLCEQSKRGKWIRASTRTDRAEGSFKIRLFLNFCRLQYLAVTACTSQAGPSAVGERRAQDLVSSGFELKAACVPGKEDSKPSDGVYILIFGFVR